MGGKLKECNAEKGRCAAENERLKKKIHELEVCRKTNKQNP